MEMEMNLSEDKYACSFGLQLGKTGGGHTIFCGGPPIFQTAEEPK